MSSHWQLLISTLAVCALGFQSNTGTAQGTSGHIDSSASSEWEATAFNNGRRIVRDSNGYFHAFWHSQPNPALPPAGAGADIYYAYTTTTATQPPSMAAKLNWSTPVNLTSGLGNFDNRYPSVAIEYEIYDGNWKATNRLHVVWQASVNVDVTTRYDIMYASLPVSAPPVSPAPWASQTNLSLSPTDSLAPAITINQYSPDVAHQHLHVVWQEEDTITPGNLPGTTDDVDFSDIAYIRSVDSGTTWSGTAPHWGAYQWRNLTQTMLNSQIPSISSVLDQFSGSPATLGRNDFGYNSNDVHVVYNEDLMLGIHVFLLRSPDDGVTWNPRVDVSVATGIGAGYYYDYYPNVAVDLLDNEHIVFMRTYGAAPQAVPREPMRTGPLQYAAGVNPALWQSFPGPDPGMYGAIANTIVYTWNNGGPGPFWPLEVWTGDDAEFPTVALNRYQHLCVNWQQYTGAPTSDYEVMRALNLNTIPPMPPPAPLPVYAGWNPVLKNDSSDAARDDLFPNLAEKKTAMYLSPPEAATAGYDEVWTKIDGHGPAAAIQFAKEIWQDGNTTYDAAVPVAFSSFTIE